MADDCNRQFRDDDPFLTQAQVHRALGGDRMAMRGMADRILRYRPLVYKNLKLRCRGHAEAAAWLDDCMQDLLVRMLYSGQRGKQGVAPILTVYCATRGAFPGFMKIVVFRYVWRWVERQRRKALGEEGPEESDERLFSEELDRALFADAVLNLLYAEFEERDRSLFHRLLVARESREDAAAAESMRVDAVHQWYSRTKRRAAEIARELENTVKKAPGRGN